LSEVGRGEHCGAVRARTWGVDAGVVLSQGWMLISTC